MLATIVECVRLVALLVLFFGLSIFVHELGHFIVARWCGLVVEVFSIGFGPSIWQTKHKGIIYKIGWIPLGGYVALPQLDPSGMDGVQGDSSKLLEKEGETPVVVSQLPSITPWKKILVSVAGVICNMIFALFLAWLVYIFGMPAGPEERSGAVGYVNPKSEAYQKGLRLGDEIVAVNEIQVKKWTDIRMEVALHQKVTLHAVSPDGSPKTLEITTTKGFLGEQSLGGVDGPNLCMVLETQPGMSAEKAGILKGDVIVGFAGEQVFSRAHLIQLVNVHKGETVVADVSRVVDGQKRTVSVDVTPEVDPDSGMVRIGIMFNLAAVELDTIVRPKPLDQIKSHATLIFRVLGALVTPKQSKAAASGIAGPVGIVASYWMIVKTSFMLAVWFTGLLNVNLAILNLLPIPILDGGHITFAFIEMIRRKPMNAKFVNALSNVFVVVLLGLFAILTIRDVDRFTPVGRYVKRLFGADEKAQSALVVTNAPAISSTNAPATE
jgi:regulator of sigma E protease